MKQVSEITGYRLDVQSSFTDGKIICNTSWMTLKSYSASSPTDRMTWVLKYIFWDISYKYWFDDKYVPDKSCAI